MSHRILSTLLLTILLSPGLRGDDAHPTLPIGAQAPDFCLPGIDDKTHCLKEYDSSKVLAIVFTCNHCPTAQLYENRVKQLASDYRDRGVALVAIEPNDPQAVRLDEMGYTDVSDSFAEMKIRAEYRRFNFPYLYDGETQRVARAYGPSATPHVFILTRNAVCVTKGELTTIRARRTSHKRTCATPSTPCWRGSPCPSRELLLLVARPSGLSRRKVGGQSSRKLSTSRLK
jgi:glutathione peroxidase-family protein